MAARKKAASRKPAKKTKKARPGKTAKAVKRKAPARKAASKPAKKKAPVRKKQIVGEGDYEASRAFFKDQANFVKKNKARIPRLGKAAEAALQGPEGTSLRAAEEQARSHARREEGGIGAAEQEGLDRAAV